MPSITIKNIPNDLYDQLKQAANVHHRSINSELIYCLEKTLRPAPLDVAELEAATQVLRNRVSVPQVDADEISRARNQGRE